MTKKPDTFSPILADNLILLAQRYAGAIDRSLGTVSTMAVKDGKFFVNLIEARKSRGSLSFTIRKYDEIVAWFASAKWPQGSEMPALTDPRHYPHETEKVPDGSSKTEVRQAESRSEKVVSGKAEGGKIRKDGKAKGSKGGKGSRA